MYSMRYFEKILTTKFFVATNKIFIRMATVTIVLKRISVTNKITWR